MAVQPGSHAIPGLERTWRVIQSNPLARCKKWGVRARAPAMKSGIQHHGVSKNIMEIGLRCELLSAQRCTSSGGISSIDHLSVRGGGEGGSQTLKMQGSFKSLESKSFLSLQPAYAREAEGTSCQGKPGLRWPRASLHKKRVQVCGCFWAFLAQLLWGLAGEQGQLSAVPGPPGLYAGVSARRGRGRRTGGCSQ